MQNQIDPARLAELYYWEREARLLPIIRIIATMPKSTLRKIELFLRNVSDPWSIRAEVLVCDERYRYSLGDGQRRRPASGRYVPGLRKAGIGRKAGGGSRRSSLTLS